MSFKKHVGKYVFNMLVPKPKVKFKGQSTVEAIKSKSKKFKSMVADEARRAREAEFKKKPWKKMKISKKEYDDIPF